jgi:hypothetical protein
VSKTTTLVFGAISILLGGAVFLIVSNAPDSMPESAVAKKQLGRLRVVHIYGCSNTGTPFWMDYETNEVGHDGQYTLFRDINRNQDYRLSGGSIMVIERYPLNIVFQPKDPQDKKLLLENPNTVITGTKLPSGFQVPTAGEDRDWMIRGDTIRLEERVEGNDR